MEPRSNQLIEKKELRNDKSQRDKSIGLLRLCPLTAQLYGKDYSSSLRLILFKMDGK